MTMDDYDDDHCLPSHVRDKSSITRVEYEIFFGDLLIYDSSHSIFYLSFISCLMEKKVFYNLAVCYCSTLFY